MIHGRTLGARELGFASRFVKGFCTLLLTFVCLGTANVFAYYDSAADLALLQPATTDSAGGSSFLGNDGDIRTRWCAADGQSGHWWKVDLQGYYNLTKVSLRMEKAGVIYRYRVEGSTDGSVWTVISDQSNSTSTSQDQELTVTAQSTRWVRVVFTSIVGGYWASFYDVKVYGLQTPGSNVALNAVAYSDSEGLNDRASLAVDGDSTTKWCAANGLGSKYLKLDLGKKFDLSGTDITWETAGTVYRYKVEASADNSTWIQVLDRSANNRQEQQQAESFTAQGVRFVKLTVVSVAGGYWPSIRELKVLGALSPMSNIAVGKVSKSDGAGAANPVEYGNDADLGTRWCATDGGANHWWEVDFDGLADISGTQVKWENSGVTYRYKIEVSTDEYHWTTVVDKTTSNPSTNQVQSDTFVASNVRFLRITVAGVSGGYWASFFDLAVNGRIVRDESVLTLEAKKDFDYFWNNASSSPAAWGMIREGQFGTSPTYPADTTSISSTGFGLTALPIGVARGWITWQQGHDRALGTLNTLRNLQITTGWKGHLYHYYGYVDGAPGGNAAWNLDRTCILDTVLMLNGVIAAGEYFGGDVKAKAYEIFNATDWEAFRNPSTNLFMMEYNFNTQSFTPDQNPQANEGFLMHIYAAGSTTLPVANLNTFYAWSTPKKTYGFDLLQVISGTDFVFQYPQQIVDFRGLEDQNGVDWWSNSVLAAMNAKKFATDYQNAHLGFGPDSWGLVACEGPYGYKYYGSAPSDVTDDNYWLAHSANDGTISPSGPAGFLNMIPKFGTRTLDYYYYNEPGTWSSVYGFIDSYNRDLGFFRDGVLAYDKGIALQAIENNRTGLLWRSVMQSPVVQSGLSKLGFVAKADQ